MRILAIDAGNTRIKWGVHDDGSWVVQGWLSTARAERLARAWAAIGMPDTVIAANVAGERVALLLSDGTRQSGHARGVAEDGSLLLETRAGLKRFHSGEVSLRPVKSN